MEELFDKPENFNIIPFPNIWEEDDLKDKYGRYFIPAYQPPISPYGELMVGIDPIARDADVTMAEVFEMARIEEKQVMILKARHRLE